MEYILYQRMAEEAYEKLRFFTWYMYRLGVYSPDMLAHLDKQAEILLTETVLYIKKHHLSPQLLKFTKHEYCPDTPERVKWFCCQSIKE